MNWFTRLFKKKKKEATPYGINYNATADYDTMTAINMMNIASMSSHSHSIDHQTPNQNTNDNGYDSGSYSSPDPSSYNSGSSSYDSGSSGYDSGSSGSFDGGSSF